MTIPGRAYDFVEEVANAVTHGVGIVAALIALPWLIVVALNAGDGWRVAGVVVFALTALLLFSASTLYHSLPAGRAKQLFRVFDHAAIYLLIAGTYTPFTIGVMRGAWGWTLFAIVWALAVLGVVLKGTLRFRFPIASTVLYIAMGWVAVVAVRPLLLSLTRPELAWLLAGGLVYTGGVPFYASRRRYGHAVWHLFVLAGAICHFVAVLLVAA
jgi:hemolysin III